MNPHQVIWVPFAYGKLADLWLKAADRNAVSQASNRIDTILAHSPNTKGKAVGRGYRLLVEIPLAVLFTVDQKAHEVIVHEVRYYPMRVNGAVQRR